MGSCTIGPMTVPGRVEAAQLLCSLDPPDWLLRHSRAVAEVAAWLAARTLEAGDSSIDPEVVEAGALLHDVDKALPPDDPLRARRHGDGSAAWLTGRGHPELAAVVADHPVTRLADGARFDRWLESAPPEALLVAYADKRAGQRLASMDARFASWRRRYPRVRLGRRTEGWDDDTLQAVRARASRLERRVCERAGVAPVEVRRLRWTAGAIRALGATSTGPRP
jgi:putative nucleotidyltransferase with HDIG domain